MSNLAKGFVGSIFGITAIFIYILVFNNISNSNHDEEVILASKLVKLPGIAISTTYVENRILGHDDYSNDFYLGMKRDSYTSFVYVK